MKSLSIFSPLNVFNGLMTLCLEDDDKKFIFNDYKADEKYSYRVFTYQIPNYMDYLKPYAKECRGSMFLINTDTKEMVSLVCLPMAKFFTYGENDNTKDIDFSKIKRLMLKPDGSLISSYIDLKGELAFKTKKMPAGQSELNTILMEALTPELFKEISNLTKTHTVDLELTSPYNRVILEYKDTSVTILKARNRFTGESLDLFTDEFKSQYPLIYSLLPEVYDVSMIENLDSKNKFLNIKNIEGFVMEMDDGEMYKVKTMYYLSQNRFANLQDFSKYDKLLVEAAIEETFDELRTLFHYRNRSENYNIQEILTRMDIIEEKVSKSYNPFVFKIESFHKEHSELTLQQYIAKIHEMGMTEYFNLLIPMYKGLKSNIKSFYLKNIGYKLSSKS